MNDQVSQDTINKARWAACGICCEKIRDNTEKT